MQPSNIAYRNTRYKFGTFCRINQRNPAFGRGYQFRLTVPKGLYYSFVKSCEMLLGKGSYKYTLEWYQHEKEPEKFTSWLCSSKDYEVFFKDYADFEQVKTYYLLAHG